MDHPPLLGELTQKELVTLSRKMRRVINEEEVGDYAWLDAEELYGDAVREAFRRWNKGRWKEQ